MSDAFVYTANWGTHQFMLKIPRDLIDLNLAESYCGERFDIYVSQDCAILDFVYHDEDGYDYDYMEADHSWMASMLPLRDAIMQGDLRALYLGWLSSAWEDDNAEEPPLPPGMSQLSGPLQTFADFMQIDEHLLQAATQGDSQALLAEPSDDEMSVWVAALPTAEKDDLLLGLLAANTDLRSVSGRLRQRFYTDWRQDRGWQRVTDLLSTTQQNNYDEAVQLLVDLRDLATDPEPMVQWEARVAELRQRYARRSSLMQRFDTSGFPHHPSPR